MFKLALFICLVLLVIGAVMVSADGPTTTFSSPLPTTCNGIQPTDTVTNSLPITATQIITDSLSLSDTSDFFRLLPRCPTPYHLRQLVIRPLVPGFVPKARIWIGNVGPNGTYWGATGWDLPNNLAECASDWHKCTITLLMGCPPRDYYTAFHVEVGTGGLSQDVSECRGYRVEWTDYKTYLPLVVR